MSLNQYQAVSVSDIVPKYATRDENPNKMEPARFRLLVAAIRDLGFLQPILGHYNADGKIEIDDGHHRWWAAQEAGLEEISVIVGTATGNRAELQGLGMNRLRGEVDLAAAADIVKKAEQQTGWSKDQLALLTGFTQSELEDLMREVQPMAEEMLEEAAGIAPPELVAEAPSKPFVLEIRFRSKGQYQLAKRKLTKAAGKTKDLAAGLMAVLGETGEGEKS